MNTTNGNFQTPRQLLPRQVYFEPDWFERECGELFNRSWIFACIETEISENGDFHSFRYMNHSLFVVRDHSGQLQAFHNICRHRGCEVLEGSGNTGQAVVCPYHHWTYELDGVLRGISNEKPCFDNIDRARLNLKPAAVGVFHGIVFVNPDPQPKDDFSAWIANLSDYDWPHRFDDGTLEPRGEITYEMKCNWKVFYENAIDGYHLGYLHDRTLGELYPDRNVWKSAGRNVVWYSTQREGEPQSNSLLSAELAEGAGAVRLTGHENAFYPGVVMLFPLTILSPSPWGFYISILEPIGPELTNMRTLSWAPSGSPGRSRMGKPSTVVRLEDLNTHPLETGNFQIEDMWIVEKIQRNLRSPDFEFGPLAKGDGAEGPLMHFQEQILEFVPAKTV